MHKLDETITVAGQLTEADFRQAAADGFRSIINNRPDGEEPGQPSSQEEAGWAAAAGLAYRHIPFTAETLSRPVIEDFAAAMAELPGPVLAHCRSGTRCCVVWSLMAAKAGGDIDTIIRRGAEAGYQTAGLRPIMDQLAGA